jgi:DNA-binding MarR family transcriptional regulator
MSSSQDSKAPSREDLSPLELTILRSLSQRKTVSEVARLAKMAPAKVGNEIAVLQLKGYLSSDGRLTDRGLTALRG